MTEEKNSTENELALAPESATWGHILPFAAWIFLIALLVPASGLNYAIRTAIGLGLLIYFRPWRWYPSLRVKNLPIAFAVGGGIFLVWVLAETQYMNRWPSIQHAYLLVGHLPPWKIPEAVAETPYAPEVCGWSLSLVRLFGSAVVIAIIEEFFWRGFVYRWMLGNNFLKVDAGRLDWKMLLLVSLVFGIEHQRWMAGFVCGIAYGLLYIRTKDIWAACFAHMTTNFLLALYVLATGAYQFW